MLSKEWNERVHIIVEPINLSEFEGYFIELESLLSNPRAGLTNEQKLYWYRKIGFETNLLLLRENYKLLNESPSLRNIQKQLGYIVLLKIYFPDDYDYWEDWREDYLELENRVNQVGISKKDISPTLKTYKWNGLEKELTELYSSLVGTLISNENAIQDFQMIFTNVDAKEVLSPVKWHDNNVTEALYLIRCLTDSKLITNIGLKHERFKLCFVRPDGNGFSGDLRSLYSKCEKQLAPEKKQTIDSIVVKYK